MCSPQTVLDQMAAKIVEIVIQSVGGHLGYLFHYKQNMKNLEVEMDKLQELRRTIEGQIDEAKTSGEVIVDNVSDWLNGADMLRQGVETFMDEKTVKENVQCFKVSCPNFILRYKLSKEAKKKMGDVKSLSEKANFSTVAHPAPTPPELQLPSSGEYMSFDSRALVFNRIMEALLDSKLNVIGVYGTGGVGKTTMVEKVGGQVKKDGLFDEVVMAVVSQDADVIKIQGVLADRLNLKLEAETEVGRAFKLWNRLNNGKRNLVILDDIWKELKLKEIGIPITDGKKGCKVVLTSRNQRILKNMQVDIDFPIQVLSKKEAWNLFKKKMGNNVNSHDPLHDIAYAVCRECQGLPVAILAVGAALKGKSMYAWKSSLDKLRKSMLNNIEDIDPKLFISLRLSYDYLESTDAKSCYLLCCLFPEDAEVPIEELARHCMARRLLGQNPDTLEEARDIVCSVVNTLKTSCLLLDGENVNFVKMHDIVRDVAISIAREEKAFLVKHGVTEWPEMGTYDKYLAISLTSETIHELPNELVCPELHTLMLEYSSIFQRELSIEIPDSFFRGTEKLMVLELNRVVVFPLPSSLGKLTELRMLCLNECKLGDIAILEYLKNKLEVLGLRGSDIKALPTEVGELTRLRLLDLRDCDKLKVIPNGVICKLHRLEELHFPSNFKNWETTTANKKISKVSLDELMSLTRLSTLDIHIPDHRLLPTDLGFLNLIRFYITVGGGHYYGESHSSTGVLVLRDISTDDDFNILERILGKPKWRVERGGLYPSRSFNNLTEVKIQDCRLKYLFSPSCARGLLQLQRLEIFGSDIMEAVIGNEGEKDEEIVENVINFIQLKSVHLGGLRRLISFYPHIKKATTENYSFAPAQSLFNEKVAFPALQELNISNVPRITAIWDVQTFPVPEKAVDSSFSQLRTMRISYCSNLMNVVQGFSKMEIRGTKEIKEKQVDHDYVLQFLQLRILTLYNLGRLSSFSDTSIMTETMFNHKIAFPALQELYIHSVPTITAIWDIRTFSTPEKAADSSFSQLWNMQVSYCSNLVNVVQGFPNMEVRGTEDRNYVLRFPHLRILTLYHLGRLSSFNSTSIITETRPLFNHQVAFPVLEELCIFSVPNITEIWNKNLLPTESFCLLRSLKVWSCEKLMNVAPSHMLPLLRNIKTLDVYKCPEMEVIVVLEKREEETQEATNKDIILFPELRTMTLRKLDNLKSVCAYNVQVLFPKLRTLDLDKHSKKMSRP